MFIINIGMNDLGDPKEIRTPVAGVRGRYPRPLDDGAIMWVGCFSNSTNTAVWIRHKRFSNSMYQVVPYRATNSKNSKDYVLCTGLQVIFATITLTELLYYSIPLRCVYRATHGAHNLHLTLLQLPKPVRFSPYLLPTFLSIVRFSGDPWGSRTPDFTVKGWCLSRLTKGPNYS